MKTLSSPPEVHHLLSHSKTSRPWITCVVPAFNEADGISTFINELCTYLAGLTDHYDVIVVNDGSSDGTGFAMLYAVFIIIRTLIYGVDVPGWATLVVAITFLGGIQLLSIGILGEYVARIFTEVKRRPGYVVSERHGFPCEKQEP